MRRYLGVALALVVFMISGYEALALTTSLPTISRILQGWRDSGFGSVVLIITLAILIALAWFGHWLYHHLRYDRRSNE